MPTSKREKPKREKLKQFGNEYFEFVTSVYSKTDLNKKKNELKARFFRSRSVKRGDHWDIYRLAHKFKKFRIEYINKETGKKESMKVLFPTKKEAKSSVMGKMASKILKIEEIK
ncbi:MAG: hypothetical protein HWN67_05805 [Candidatus Helarchaeota archaeon]|nr:hypothetical protein [Candidatus Helarchaeota archaeon]